MDDITPRREYRGERRDFSVPHRPPMPEREPEPAPQPPTPAHHQPITHHAPKPHPHAAAHHPHQIHHLPESHAPQATEAAHHPAQPHQDIYYRPQPAEQPAAQPKTRQLPNLKSPKVIIAIVIIVLGSAAFMAFKPAKSKEVLPADLAKQANFSVYYPNPVPAGYAYDKTISTFTNGQVYYLLNKGTEHIIVREQAWSSDTLDTSSLTNPTPVQISAGKAAIGTNTSQTAAAVLTNSTLITITSNGYVPQADVTALINNLKSLGQKN